MISKFALLRTAACFAAVVALTATAATADVVVLDTFDADPGSPTHNGFRSVSWTEPDTMTNNTGDTRGGQARGFINGVDASATGYTDASAGGAVMTISLTENVGNELPGIGKVMVADVDDRRWIFQFDNSFVGSLGAPATADTTTTLVSNATSGRALGEGLNDGNDFNFSSMGQAGGQLYWIQVFDLQVGGGAHPINLTFDSMSIGAVPEPSSLSILALGGVLGLVRRRKA